MNRIFHHRRSRLIGGMHALGIRLQIHGHRSLGGHIARRRIVLEIGARNAIEAAGVPAIDDDLDVVEFGVSSTLELHRLGRADREQRASFFGLGNGKALRRLRNLNPEFLGDIVHDGPHPPARIEVHPRHRENNDDRARRKPATQAGNRERHV